MSEQELKDYELFKTSYIIAAQNRGGYDITSASFIENMDNVATWWRIALDWERTDPDSPSNQKIKSLEKIINE